MKIIVLLCLALVAFLGSVRGDQEEVRKIRMNGRVRLNNQGFTNTNAGIIEVYFKGEWGMVCADSNLDMKMANVVCRQMGFDLAVELAQPDEYFDDSVDPDEKIWHNVLKCNGDEGTIRDCQVLGSLGTPGQTESSCPRSSYAAVVCGDNVPDADIITKEDIKSRAEKFLLELLQETKK
ncbi:scavenger receptor cysteine-rich type 1 protein M130-like [Lytechinus pictus]|uniref:scavenger receptor cysteine-rich type 1 protein M130-like n=1 Tax=Lytechinus pictus TaxID=7653 RepID=UPI0030B9E5FA